jgi:hypothetical protein
VTEEAILLTDGSASLENDNIAKVLRFFGVPWRALTMTELLAHDGGYHESSSKFRLLCSAETFLRLVEECERSAEGIRFWQQRVHSAFVYAGKDSGVLQKLIRRITSDDQASLRQMNGGAGEWVVSNSLAEFCGVMSGLRIPEAGTAVGAGPVIGASERNVTAIISTDRGATFVKVEHHTVPVFLSTFGSIVDINDELNAGNFDVRNHIGSAVPVVLYVKWAFAETCWNAPEANACLVIDDPLLKPSYGFINFQELLGLMERHRFSTNIAFIPWNWRRSDREVVRLFKENPEKYSLSIHGCDHTGAEFGSHNHDRLRSRARLAAHRMSGHESKTGLRHERIMVFPQGVFSEAAIGVLKHANFTAVVNTEVVGTAPQATTVTVSDVWDIAVMGYGSFPIFTRRYPSQGVENFAFDILLGKPCIVVIHHDFCRDSYARLLEFIDKLNALQRPLSWRGLGEVVRRSCRQRELSTGAMEVEMYGTELRVKNRSDQRKRFIIRRRESDPRAIKEIRVESDRITWDFSQGCIAFEIELNPGESRTVNLRFHDLPPNGQCREKVGYRVKTLLRRYLSEARDNYVTTTKSRLACLGRKTAEAKQTPNTQRPTLNVQ